MCDVCNIFPCSNLYIFFTDDGALEATKQLYAPFDSTFLHLCY